MQPHPPVIGFDLDGVVLRNPFGTAIMPRVCEHLRSTALDLSSLPQEEADRRVTERMRAAWHSRLDAGEHVAAYDWDGLYRHVCESFGVEPALDLAQLYRECCESDGVIGLMPGARESLETLRAHGLRLVAITNGYRVYQWPQLEALGVASLFDDVVTPEVAGYAKPNPALFRAIPGLQAHVGDIAYADVLGANLAGLRSVWLHKNLPEALRTLRPADRPGEPSFREYLAGLLAASPFMAFYPEANVETCTPDAVAVDIEEAADVLIEWYVG